MAEYIKRERVVDVLVDMETLALYEDAIPAIKNIRRLIDGIPAADVAPVRHGRWERRECGPGELECKCSVCGYRDFMIPWHDNYWFERSYCPNCGAKMDKEEDKA